MFDIKIIRENSDVFDAGMVRRNCDPMASKLLELDKIRRNAQTKAQKIQTRRNELSKVIGKKKSINQDATAEIKEVSETKEAQGQAEDEVKKATEKLNGILSRLPNIPAHDVPDGDSDAENVEIRVWGDKPTFPFEAKQHFELGELLRQMNFESATRISGSRFVVLSHSLARMERALASFMLDLHVNQNGFIECSPPLLVRNKSLFGTGQLPKFEDDLFKTTDDFYLIPTAEVPLTNLFCDMLLDEDNLPLRYAAATPCFRSEAGSAGQDTRGMIRQHQFYKVEMVAITKPKDSDAEHDRMIACAEEILKLLDLPYRIVNLCVGDLGFSSRKTYDIEVWLAGQKRFREISSISNCGEFQAIRMKCRYRVAEGKSNKYVHTLNGSGLAVGRTLVAIMERYQQENGTIVVPDVLRNYMGGLKLIEPQV